MTENPPSSFSYRLILSQALNAFGDHGAKIVVASLIGATFPENAAAVWVGAISFLYVAPYILFGPIAGKLGSRFAKTRIVQGSLLLQTGAMLGLAASAWAESMAGAMLSLALVAAQSCFLAPARNALLKDLAGPRKIGQLMGLIGMAGVAATLVGLSLGGWSFDRYWEALGSPWKAAALAAGVSAVVSFVAFVSVLGIREREKELESGESFVAAFKRVVNTPSLRWSSLGLAWFYGVGSLMVMILLQDGRWDHGGDLGSASQGGAMAALLGAGVALGSGLAAYLCRRRVEVGLSFIGALGLLVFVPLTSIFWESDALSSIGVFLLGIAGGLFSAPLNALFVSSVPQRSGTPCIAVNNMIINVVSAGFVLIGSGLGYLGWSPESQLWVVSATSAVVVVMMTYLVPESLIRLLLLAIARCFYRVRVTGAERIPEEGGVLLVANHVSYADALLIYAAAGRPVRFIGTDEMLRYRLLRWAYRRFKVIAVSPTKARDAIGKTVEALKAGEVVCLFPEGALTRTGALMPFKKGAELVARLANVPVAPAHIDGMWRSVFSFSDKPFRFRLRDLKRRSIQISFGDPNRSGSATIESMRESILDLEHDAFSRREALEESLGLAALRALKLRPLKTRLVDRGLDGARFRNVELLLAGFVFADAIKREAGASRVGILLPPGLAGFAANLGALWAGVSSVNLNPTVSRSAISEMVSASGVSTIVSSRAFLSRFPDLPLEGVRIVYAEETLSRAKTFGTFVRAALCMALPTTIVARLYGLEEKGGNREASLLFSSGSSASPKGVPLSHRNLLANATQLSEIYLMKRSDTILSNLPLFHSFGLTGGLWLPLLSGMRIVSYVSPLRVAENVAAIREEAVDVLLGTPTFLRGYLKRANREDLSSVRLTVAGAESLPVSLARDWEERFGSPILEGYGLTECSPVVSANCLQSSALAGRYAVTQRGWKSGRVGRPLPGVRIRIARLDDRATGCPAGESGVIQIKGPNVFRGYLGAEANAERFTADGWLDTGDVGALDDDGFLRIEGRLSRFSKIAGEMVSHACVEAAIERAFPERDLEEARRFFVASLPCERKGERLVLLSRLGIDLGELAKRLREEGIPNLWIPSELVTLERFPELASGKLDLSKCLALCAA